MAQPKKVTRFVGGRTLTPLKQRKDVDGVLVHFCDACGRGAMRSAGATPIRGAPVHVDLNSALFAVE